MAVVLAVVLAAGSLALHGQAPASAAAAAGPELSAALERLGAEAETLRTALPNFECTETVTSRRLRDEKETWVVHLTGTLRAVRDSAGESDESFTLVTLEGKPAKKNKFKVPVYVRGGFASALDSFSRSRRGCYAYTLANGRIDFHGVAGANACGHVDGLAGFALLDAACDVTHVERTVPEDTAQKFHIAPFAAVDFAPVELNGRVYRLSSRLVSTWANGKFIDHFDAEYTGCKLFAASVTLLPGSTVVSDEPAAAEAAKPK